MKHVLDDLFSVECVLIKKLVVVSYIVDDFIRQKNPCFCKLKLIKIVRNFIRRLMIYSVPLVFNDMKYDLNEKSKQFLENAFTSSSVSAFIFNYVKPIISVIVELLIEEYERILKSIQENKNYVPLTEYEDLLEAMIDYLEISVLTINNIYIDCSKCSKDMCIKRNECSQHSKYKKQIIHIFLFNQLLTIKENEFIDALKSVGDNVGLSNVTLIADGRFIKYRNGILEKLDSFMEKLSSLSFKDVYFYKFMQVPEKYRDLIIFDLSPIQNNNIEGGVINGLDAINL